MLFFLPNLYAVERLDIEIPSSSSFSSSESDNPDLTVGEEVGNFIQVYT